VDELPEGVVGVAEALGGLLLGEAVEEDAAEGLVLTLGRARGLGEESTGGVLGHGRGSWCEVISR
jgi:hypothetical protein